MESASFLLFMSMRQEINLSFFLDCLPLSLRTVYVHPISLNQVE